MGIRLAGRKVFLTGPAGNLGPVWMKLLSEQGATVHGFGLPNYDLTNQADRERAVGQFWDSAGAPDILLHNAAVDNPPGSKATFFGNVKDILAVNLEAAVHLTELWLPRMESAYNFDFQEQPRNIVFIGSMLGVVASNTGLYPPGFDKPLAYGATKAALWNFCKNLNVRYAKKGIVSNMLSLSAVEGGQDKAFREKYTDRIPIRRMLQKEDFALEFLTVCSSRVPYGNQLLVCGGYTIW